MKRNLLIHKLFRLSIFLKGIFSLLELISGFVLLIISSEIITKTISYLFSHELTQDPGDIIANFLTHLFSNISGNLKLFFAIYLISHGIIKLGLIAALWKRKLWAYPLSAVIFSLFILYQIYRYLISPSFFIVILTMIDLLVIVLIYFEYQRIKKRIKK